MTSPLTKLLTLGALLWVAPLGAEPRESSINQSWGSDESGCPYERAEAARLEQLAGKSDAPLLGGHGPSAALLP